MTKIATLIEPHVSPDSVEAAINESLKILMELCETKAAAATAEIEKNLTTDKKDDHGIHVPITKVLKTFVDYRATVRHGRSDVVESIAKSLENMITTKKGIATGVSNIIGDALDIIMGRGVGEESVTKVYAVVEEGMAIVRYDFWAWGRNISAEKLRKKVTTAFACVFFKSAVDVSKLEFNDFLALYNEVLLRSKIDERNILGYFDSAQKIFERFQAKPLRMQFARSQENSSDAKQPQLRSSAIPAFKPGEIKLMLPGKSEKVARNGL